MKNILICSGVFPPEPITSAKLNFDLAMALSDKYGVTVLTPKPTRPYGYVFDNAPTPSYPFKHIVLDSYTHPRSSFIGRMRESISFGRKCKKFIEENKEDIDFVYNCGWQIFGLYIIAKTCVKYNIPYIVPIQDVYPESLSSKLPQIRFIKWLLKHTIGKLDKYYQRHAYRVRTITDSMADYLSRTRNVTLENYLVVANWQDETCFINTHSSQIYDETIRFMFAGNNNKQANVDLIIYAFMKANIPNSKLYIMGGGNAKEHCEQIVNDSKCENIFFGNIPEGKVAEIQEKADVMVLALKKGTGTQGVPSKLTAYMLSGKPIIASVDTNCDTARIIHNANCGIVVAPDDINALADAFIKISQMKKSTLDDLGKNSKEYALKNLSRTSNLEKICNCIIDLLGK